MDITITGKNIQVGEALTQRIETAIDLLLQKYFSGRGEAQVILVKEASGFQCDIKIHLQSGVTLHAKSQNNSDATSVFTETEEKVAKQLRRYKRRLNDYNRSEQASLQTTEYVLKSPEEEIEEETAQDVPLIIAEETQEIIHLSVNNAVMHMDLSNLDYLLFKNIGTDRLNLLYRRPDGNYGWLDPKQ